MDWQSLSLAEQLGNVGSEFERAIRWKQKKQASLAHSAGVRTLEQLNKTLADDKHVGARRKEIARLRDEVCKELFTSEGSNSAKKSLMKYFLAFAFTARIKK